MKDFDLIKRKKMCGKKGKKFISFTWLCSLHNVSFIDVLIEKTVFVYQFSVACRNSTMYLQGVLAELLFML